jgi:hypothetical protein
MSSSRARRPARALSDMGEDSEPILSIKSSKRGKTRTSSVSVRGRQVGDKISFASYQYQLCITRATHDHVRISGSRVSVTRTCRMCLTTAMTSLSHF